MEDFEAFMAADDDEDVSVTDTVTNTDAESYRASPVRGAASASKTSMYFADDGGVSARAHTLERSSRWLKPVAKQTKAIVDEYSKLAQSRSDLDDTATSIGSSKRQRAVDVGIRDSAALADDYSLTADSEELDDKRRFFEEMGDTDTHVASSTTSVLDRIRQARQHLHQPSAAEPASGSTRHSSLLARIDASLQTKAEMPKPELTVAEEADEPSRPTTAHSDVSAADIGQPLQRELTHAGEGASMAQRAAPSVQQRQDLGTSESGIRNPVHAEQQQPMSDPSLAAEDFRKAADDLESLKAGVTAKRALSDNDAVAHAQPEEGRRLSSQTDVVEPDSLDDDVDVAPRPPSSAAARFSRIEEEEEEHVRPEAAAQVNRDFVPSKAQGAVAQDTVDFEATLDDPRVSKQWRPEPAGAGSGASPPVRDEDDRSADTVARHDVDALQEEYSESFEPPSSSGTSQEDQGQPQHTSLLSSERRSSQPSNEKSLEAESSSGNLLQPQAANARASNTAEAAIASKPSAGLSFEDFLERFQASEAAHTAAAQSGSQAETAASQQFVQSTQSSVPRGFAPAVLRDSAGWRFVGKAGIPPLERLPPPPKSPFQRKYEARLKRQRRQEAETDNLSASVASGPARVATSPERRFVLSSMADQRTVLGSEHKAEVDPRNEATDAPPADDKPLHTASAPAPATVAGYAQRLGIAGDVQEHLRNRTEEDKLREEIFQLRSEVKTLRSQLKRQDLADMDMDAKYAEQEQLIQEYQKENEHLYAKVKLFESGEKRVYGDMYATNQQLERENFKLRSEVERLRSQVEGSGLAVNDQIKHLSVLLAAAEQRLQGQQEESDERINELSGHIQLLKQENERLAKEQISYRPLAPAIQESTGVQTIQTEADARAAELERQTQWLEEARAHDHREHLTEVEKLTERLREYEQAFDHAKADFEGQLEALARQLETRVTKEAYEELQLKHDELEAQLRARVLEVEQLRQQLSQAQAGRDEDSMRATDQIQDLQDRLDKALAVIEKKTQQVSQLERELEAQMSTTARLNERLTEEAFNKDTLMSRLETMQTAMKAVEKRLAEAPTRDLIVEYEDKITTMTRQIERLQAQLDVARQYHTPTMRHYEMMEMKLEELSLKYQQREARIKEMEIRAKEAADIRVKETEERWRQKLQAKAKETDRFRQELDVIVGVLQQLQRQGVRLPIPSGTAHLLETR